MTTPCGPQGKCLAVTGTSNADGTKVALGDCTGSARQVWVHQPNNTLLNPQSGKCLDDASGGRTKATQLRIYACGGGGGGNQRWTYSP